MQRQRLYFAQVLEGLYLKALRGRVSLELKEKLAAAGLDLHRLETGYPAEQFAELLDITAAELYPDLPRERALWQLGSIHFDGHTSTLVGAAMLTMLKVLGIRSTLDTLERFYGVGSNFLRVRTRHLGPSEAEIWINDVHGQPSYHQGVLHRGALCVGADEVELEIAAIEGAGCTYRIRWRE